MVPSAAQTGFDSVAAVAVGEGDAGDEVAGAGVVLLTGWEGLGVDG